ncbi:MAG: hypothetical protein ABJO52_15370 [Nisaea sp.]|uniref:hypothetical protein n=1 Tax=Nisaea sp. TaxID=2024842 RepID=UPI0032993E31
MSSIEDCLLLLRWHLSGKGFSPSQLSNEAGLSTNALSKVHDDGFNPRLNTLRRALNAIPAHRKAEWHGHWTWSQPNLLAATVATKHERIGGTSMTERVLTAESSTIFEPGQIGSAWRYLQTIKIPGGQVDLRRLDFTLLKALAPDCLVHLVAADDTDPLNYSAEIWDPTPGFKKGADLTGMKVRETGDAAYERNLTRNYFASVGANRPVFGFLRRTGPDGLDRPFLRLLVPCIGGDGLPKLVVLTKPQETSLAAYVLNEIRS